jgi:hypothetical protein
MLAAEDLATLLTRTLLPDARPDRATLPPGQTSVDPVVLKQILIEALAGNRAIPTDRQRPGNRFHVTPLREEHCRITATASRACTPRKILV